MNPAHWAYHAIQTLAQGESCTVTPHGTSMLPRIASGATVTLVPPSSARITLGTVVLVKVKGNIYLHLIKAIRGKDDAIEFLIGNNKGGLNGWVSPNSVYGVATNV